jgi:hypothetical protein
VESVLGGSAWTKINPKPTTHQPTSTGTPHQIIFRLFISVGCLVSCFPICVTMVPHRVAGGCTDFGIQTSNFGLERIEIIE